MDTIKPAIAIMTMNSSYVLISTTLSARLGAGGSTSPDCLGKHIILSKFCKGSDISYPPFFRIAGNNSMPRYLPDFTRCSNSKTKASSAF